MVMFKGYSNIVNNDLNENNEWLDLQPPSPKKLVTFIVHKVFGIWLYKINKDINTTALKQQQNTQIPF